MLGNYSVSISLPEVMSYFMVSKNPLLDILEDQIYQDTSMPHLSGNDLIRCILEDLEEGAIPWPKEFSMIECKEWSQKMKIDTNFYLLHAESAKEMTAYEIGLLKLASNVLRKRIILVPLLETDSVQTIEPSDPRICTGQYHIAYCNKLRSDNFFLSVFPKKQGPNEIKK